uniref:Ubiquitin carboxyl-terminal hydrolase n=1 Tax=Monopterus albus TaxID=43700 RepID=A0A3Q3J145_MONAL|nr:ubiquitin carboxyl-terminal hydrolase 37-like [Monopterus albus]
MFCFPRKKKKHQFDVEVADQKLFSKHKSINVKADPKQKSVVPETLATSATAVSTPVKASREKSKKVSWWRRWFCRKKKPKNKTPVKEDVAENGNLPTSSATKDIVRAIEEPEGGETGVQRASPTLDPPVSAELHFDDKNVTEDTNQSSSLMEEIVITDKESEGKPVQEASSATDPPASVAPETGKIKKSRPPRCHMEKESPAETNEGVPALETAEGDSDDKLTQVQEDAKSYSNDTSGKKEMNYELAAKLIYRQFNPSGYGGCLQAESKNISPQTNTYKHSKNQFASSSKKNLSKADLACLGFPNLAQTCYMNSTLQGLLTLKHFVHEFNSQKTVWNTNAKCQIIRCLVELEACRTSNSMSRRKQLLAAFKQSVAEFNSEFDDDGQQDAHEFLICVLDKMRSLSLELQEEACSMGFSYTCPVNAHIAFQMLNTMTCRRCGVQSTREEDYTALSLDLVPGSSVWQCLQQYLKGSYLEYHCECGAKESSQQWSFLTLPNVLILHLKRLRFTPSFEVEKVVSPIILSRELVVHSEPSSTQQTMSRYSLVSVISHLGYTAHSGHYICDGAYPEEPGDVTDRWLTYNDKHVSKTTGASVCYQRQKTACLLFYEKQL